MNLLSNTVIAFVPRRPAAVTSLRAAARDTLIPTDIACRWQRDRLTARLT